MIFFGRKLNPTPPHILTMLITLVQNLVVVILLLTKYSELNGCLAHLITFNSTVFRPFGWYLTV